MNERDFCYWLQGFSKLTGESQGLSAWQWKMIQEHLALVFNKVTSDQTELKLEEARKGIEY